ncbi:MAG: tetratricopeptide repeat protein [Candidatus Tumulicola sp.]
MLNVLKRPDIRRLVPSFIIATVAAVGIGFAPVILDHSVQAPAQYVAPVKRDYLQRDAMVAFLEKQSKVDPADQITLRMLSAQYMQRFRERYDLTDIARAAAAARRSLVLQPQGNTAAHMALGSTQLAYHDFRNALASERAALAGEPFNRNARAQVASVLMELGRYDEARSQLALIVDDAHQEDPTVDAVRARFDELTGRLEDARAYISRAMATTDSISENPAYDRSWFHMRAAQHAFEDGDARTAETEFATALQLFPDNSMAMMFEAKMFRAQGRWQETLAAATHSADIYPLPQALGYEADAQRALGLGAEARSTDELIDAEKRLFDSQGINDRLLANYYAQRGVHLDTALQAATSDYRKRGDEIYADDTMAWTLARMGRWHEARRFAQRATRTNAQDSDVQFHAGVIALHTGAVAEGTRRIREALALNPQFDPFEAPQARALLSAARQ